MSSKPAQAFNASTVLPAGHCQIRDERSNYFLGVDRPSRAIALHPTVYNWKVTVSADAQYNYIQHPQGDYLSDNGSQYVLRRNPNDEAEWQGASASEYLPPSFY